MTTINADKNGKAEQTPTAKHKSKIKTQMPNITFDPIFNSKEEKYLRAQSKAKGKKRLFKSNTENEPLFVFLSVTAASRLIIPYRLAEDDSRCCCNV